VLQNGHPPAWTELEASLRELARAAAAADAGGIRVWLNRLVPEYSGVRPDDVAIVTREPQLRVVAQRSA
jgi:hypothetical protein